MQRTGLKRKYIMVDRLDAVAKKRKYTTTDRLDPVLLERLHIEEDRTQEEIAEILGVSVGKVAYWLKKFHIKRERYGGD